MISSTTSPPATVAKRYALPEILAWVLKLDGKTDQERFAALDIPIQPYDALPWKKTKH
jgi:hypothetical protein